MTIPNAQPMLNGVLLPRPSSASKTREDAASTTVLAGGAERGFSRGHRFAYDLAWGMMRPEALEALRDAVPARRAAVPYTHTDGTVTMVWVMSGPTETPVAGTSPTRYAVSLSLREPGIRRA